MIYPMLVSVWICPFNANALIEAIKERVTSLPKGIHQVLASPVVHPLSLTPWRHTSVNTADYLLAAVTPFFLATRAPITSDIS